MVKRLFIFSLLFTFVSYFLNGQQDSTIDKWEHVKILVGKWIGEGENIGGEKISNSLFTSELDNNIIIRKNYSEYIPGSDETNQHFEDLLIIFRYPDASIKATYFDNKSRVINFNITVSDPGDTIIFLSEKRKGLSLFRITYSIIDNKNMRMSYETAESGKEKDLTIVQEYKLVKIY